MPDFLVTYRFELTARVDNVPDKEMAVEIADDRKTEQGIHALIKEAIDPTDFYLDGWALDVEVEPA